MIDIKVPTVGESITEVTLVKWLKPDGAYVQRDEVIAELESEKATFELNAEQAGVLSTKAAEGDTLKIGDVVATIDDKAAAPAGAAPAAVPVNAAPVVEFEIEAIPAKAAGKGIIEVKVPVVGESISEVTLVKWLKKDGDLVQLDDVICELESEKATFELNAEIAGQISRVAKEGEVLKIGAVLASINSDIPVPVIVSAPAPAATIAQPAAANAPVTATPGDLKASPVAAAIIADKKLDPKSVTATGTGGKIMKSDVLDALNNPGRKPGAEMFTRNEKREKMSNLRKTVSRRLVEAKNTTAMLTTFNEVDMGPIMAIRAKYKDKFKEIHGVNLGFMSFFTKAVCYALQEWPAVNAYIDGDSIIYHDYCDVSIAVSAPKGLVVPVIRNAESLSMAGIEKKVVELAGKARDNKLSMDEMQGGTFTITNGGVFGSLMSTPIINIPQSAILGMHKIQERPMAVNGQVVVKQMMYLALSYDHRIIDGRESVSFLVRVKELLEAPELLLFGKDPVKTLLEV
ncbi:2-oxoglutarate dehydrogenase complex dihydrolipoyllysine-residue succinyltransferase [Flavihumibacter profundi]|uniref:2-oxoglutarate dehydrogenase complex dihydrolipoyllysine-residue succinyltransferase n=1 Tax=Flavihumibacter profundi TaxID=2716883 RepID=UPI001CC5B526|nr:2-oxoglutarate dehydrogenase complex dihydrolipoyllysine-residue succinyltransferase [Flavihumibacter profundi]MBZ5859186.1 2-oxoglutarate dehydrogenase complex dihydrolipoyllysine-residue succinyltransferase [Flavihumibacter profundi]